MFSWPIRIHIWLALKSSYLGFLKPKLAIMGYHYQHLDLRYLPDILDHEIFFYFSFLGWLDFSFF